MLARLEQAFSVRVERCSQSTGACIHVLEEEEVFCRANGNKTPPLAGGPEGGEVKSWI